MAHIRASIYFNRCWCHIVNGKCAHRDRGERKWHAPDPFGRFDGQLAKMEVRLSLGGRVQAARRREEDAAPSVELSRRAAVEATRPPNLMTAAAAAVAAAVDTRQKKDIKKGKERKGEED